MQAEKEGADYVAFGRFSPPVTKSDAPLVTVETLVQAEKVLHIPIIAIGGMTLQNATVLIMSLNVIHIMLIMTKKQ